MAFLKGNWSKPEQPAIEPWKLQKFSPDEDALQSIFQGSAGVMPFGSKQPSKIRTHGALSELYGARAPKQARGWDSVWQQLTGASQDQRAKLEDIFSSLDPKTLSRVQRKGVRKLDSGFSEAFLGGVDAFLQEEGDWDWDFETNQWTKTARRQARDKRESIASLARNLRSQDTMTTDWGAKNVKKVVY